MKYIHTHPVSLLFFCFHVKTHAVRHFLPHPHPLPAANPRLGWMTLHTSFELKLSADFSLSQETLCSCLFLYFPGFSGPHGSLCLQHLARVQHRAATQEKLNDCMTLPTPSSCRILCPSWGTSTCILHTITPRAKW